MLLVCLLPLLKLKSVEKRRAQRYDDRRTSFDVNVLGKIYDVVVSIDATLTERPKTCVCVCIY